LLQSFGEVSMAKYLLALSLLTIGSAALSAVPNPPPMNNHPVIDAADILPPQQETALTSKLLNIKLRSGHEVAVLTVPDLGGYDIEQYSLNAARFYKLGSLDGDDGILMTVAPNEHKTRIEIGRGLTQLLTDGSAGLIIEDDMIPEFRAGDYPAGINAGVDAIAARIVPLTPAQLLAQQRETQQRKVREAQQWASFKDTMSNLFIFALAGLIVFLIYRTVTAPARRRKKEAAEAAVRERERLEAAAYAQRQKEYAAQERAERERAFEKKRKFNAWYAGLSATERKKYDDEQAAKKAAAEAKASKRRRAAMRSSSGYGGYSSGYGGYGSSAYGGSSSSSSDYGSSSSNSSFGGGGGSFDGGGSSGSW
jgi:uncharacterized membrane protein YgcG